MSRTTIDSPTGADVPSAPAGIGVSLNLLLRNRVVSDRFVDTLLIGMVLVSVVGLAYVFIVR